MKVVSGNKEILNSGVISSFGMEDLEFQIDETKNMYLVLHVEGNLQNDEATIGTEINESGKLVINVNNPHVTLNFGPSEPIRIGYIEGKNLYFTFRLNVFGEYTSYQASYTFYKEL
ncbi:DUF6864 domain-containing function [Aeromonas caviae]